MSAKPDAKESKEAAPAAEKGAAAPAPAASPVKALIPIIAALVLAPAVTWATAEFVLLPRLQKKLAAPAAGEPAAHEPEPAAESGGHGKESGGHGKEGKGKEGEGTNSYEFTNVVVNLSGTMGTRYLKTSFLVTGASGNIRGLFEEQKPRLTDVTLSVLSSLTLADLEEPGSKNLLREKLVTSYNQALGKRLVEQVYFSDFVIQ